MSRIISFTDLYLPAGKYVNVEFGNPKKKDCQGLGICNMDFSGTPVRALGACQGCRRTGAMVYYDGRAGKVELHFRRRDICAGSYARQFKGGRFTVEEHFHFTPALAQHCGLPEGSTILRGQYAYEEKGGHLRILIPLGMAVPAYY
ncbi:hypothetical protein QWY85_08975 [Neolewinella lacunae]|uniref:Uncharacterized protein n=1 Tax=Neolewinella lacunae TaxID=1517758 RepID=A0A923PRX7_9BACT|nr:hypothetical protein [Neolewinella lacunae]MBC6996646.1 hypothetical protein [Neolewinella lacunae]MDN3634789.1 hypothetical protein [Neolewinella lacunae]